jgi:predicted AAA+ superfamily ATPase
MEKLIGRKKEESKLLEFLRAPAPAIMIIHGRRRVGKTFLIEHTLKQRRYLKIEGLEAQTKRVQLRSAIQSLAEITGIKEIAEIKVSSWKRFFELAANYIPHYFDTIYLEEIQWLANYRPILISDLKHVWDNKFSKIKKFKLIICGSSPSFIIKKVIRSKALYNRSQEVISVKPFSLAESTKFFNAQKSPNELFDGYLLVGGIPPYLKRLTKRSSVLQSLAYESFLQDSFFSDEMDRIFTSSLAEHSEYRAIVSLLAKNPGLTVSQIADALKIKKGGTLSNIIDDLELSDFIRTSIPVFSGENTNLKRHYVADPYLHYYYKMIDKNRRKIRAGYFDSNPEAGLEQRTLSSLLGFAFERFCLNNAVKIAEILGFSAVSYNFGPYFNRTDGVQIDLCFDRADKVVTVCEIKYNTKPLGLEVINEMKSKLERLKIKGSKSIETVLITVNGVQPNVKKLGYFRKIITLKDLC